MGRVSRGWSLTGQSWEILKSDRSLVVFPILSIVFAILATVAIWVLALVIRGVFDGQPLQEHDPVFYIAGLATAYVSTFIAIFFNVALAACAMRSLRGEDTKVGEGVRAAVRRIGPILGWTLVATTVYLILRALEKRLPLLGSIVAWLVDAAWSIATFFVIPVIAVEGSGPWQSLKRSSGIVKARWGESATGAVTLWVLAFVVTFVIALVGGVGSALLFGAGLQPLGVSPATAYW